MPDPILAIPSPSLVLMIGPAASGKSTFCRRHFPSQAVISSDDCRAAVCGDPADQHATPAAFRLAHERLEARLQRRRLAVLDATSLEPQARAQALAIAARQHLPAIAVVLDAPAALCRKRAATRATVPLGPEVIGRHVAGLRRALPALPREGFAAVHHLKGEAAIAAARVRLSPLACDRREERGPFDVIGDVHGCARELAALLLRLGYRRRGSGPFVHPLGRRAVFIGDLVDRGPRCLDAASIAMGMVEAGTGLAVLGNHDLDLAERFAGQGGLPGPGTEVTLGQLAAAPPEERRRFRRRFAAYVASRPSHLLLDAGRLAVAHAGLREEHVGRDSDAVRRFAVRGETMADLDGYGLPRRVNWALAYRGRAFVVYGHTPVREPETIGSTLNIDTGCCYGGALTAYTWPERHLVQVEASRVHYRSPRTGRLGLGIRAETRVRPSLGPTS
ncbi:MAG TPA: AAA family ATPase [Candidatus Polarisedimenticolia bacterium]|jgi:protein phosphatase|nr:AAA family ATPase [Candidatus Polarisedimenticolia bacterium]